MNTDLELQKNVNDAINFEPTLQADHISITVEENVVTLTGTVSNFSKKGIAENAVKNVTGVKAVIENIEVLDFNAAPSDNDIAEAALKALGNSWSIPKDKVILTVKDGWVKLEGEVQDLYQKFDAKAVVAYVPGVKGITNTIKVTTEINNGIEQKEILAALSRNSELKGKNIMVKVTGTGVRLSGYVTTLHQKQEAERIVSKTKGISSVCNRLIVGSAPA